MMKGQHVDPEEAVKIHQDLQAKHSVAIHWGTFALAYEVRREDPLSPPASIHLPPICRSLLKSPTKSCFLPTCSSTWSPQFVSERPWIRRDWHRSPSSRWITGSRALYHHRKEMCLIEALWQLHLSVHSSLFPFWILQIKLKYTVCMYPVRTLFTDFHFWMYTPQMSVFHTTCRSWGSTKKMVCKIA